MIKKIINWIRYPSSQKGIVTVIGLIAGVFGYQVSPELAAGITGVIVALIGLIDLVGSDADTAAKIEKEEGK